MPLKIKTIFIAWVKILWGLLKQLLSKQFIKYIVIRLLGAILYLSLSKTLRDDTLLTEIVKNLSIFAIFISFAALCYASASVQKDEMIKRLLKVSGDNFFHSLICIVVAIVFWLAVNDIEENGILSIHHTFLIIPAKILFMLITGLYGIKSIFSFIDGFTLALLYFDIKYDLRSREKLLNEVEEDEKRIEEVKELLSLGNQEKIENPFR